MKKRENLYTNKYLNDVYVFNKEKEVMVTFVKIISIFFPIYLLSIILITYILYKKIALPEIVFLSVSILLSSLWIFVFNKEVKKIQNRNVFRLLRIAFILFLNMFTVAVSSHSHNATYLVVYLVIFVEFILFFDNIEYLKAILLTIVVFFFENATHYGFILNFEDNVFKYDFIFTIFDVLVVCIFSYLISRYYVISKYNEFKLLKQNEKEKLIDPLTKMMNKRYFMNIIDEINEEKGCVVAILIDLDHFKNVNDIFGHKKGDEILSISSDYILSVFRNCDICRIGGDEFAGLIKISENIDETRKIITERVLALLDKMPITVEEDDKRVDVTFSIGVYTSIITSTNSAEDVFAKADELMYKVKNTTRDGCAIGYDSCDKVEYYTNK